MRALFTNNWIDIEAGQALSGMAQESHTLRIASGRVWVTVEGDRTDYWLSAGDTLTLRGAGLLVVEADTQTSRIHLEPQRKPGFQLGTPFKRSLQSLLRHKPETTTACGAD